MYVVRTKVNKPPFYRDQSFVMYILRGKHGYQSLHKHEANTLVGIFNKHPEIFIEPQQIIMDKRTLEFSNPLDEERYSQPLTCDFDYLLEDLDETDREKLMQLRGRIQGFDQKFTEVDF